MAPLLQVDSLTKEFGGIRAVNQVSFQLEAGTILGMIGPNGSGKTTLLNLLNGVYRPDGGEIRLLDRVTQRLPAHQLTHLGVMRTFQNPHVFQTISLYQNMLVPLVHARIAPNAAHVRALELLAFVGLGELAEIPASELSGGQQKLLEFARALMPQPKLVLMDEPFGGMHPEIKATLIARIREMQQREQVAFVIVSHEIPNLMELSDRIICLNEGTLIADDLPQTIGQNDKVVEAYLGH